MEGERELLGAEFGRVERSEALSQIGAVLIHRDGYACVIEGLLEWIMTAVSLVRHVDPVTPNLKGHFRTLAQARDPFLVSKD